MATNKNALIRYKILDQCFRNPGRRYYLEDLMEACNKILQDISQEYKGISRRQLFDDIAFMESNEGWSIELERIRDGHKIYYRYADMSFSINNMPLNELEITQLKSAMEILSQFQGMPQFEWINEMLPKLQNDIHATHQAKGIISFDNNQYLKGIELLGSLYNAIFYKKVLEIEYQPFTNQSPYRLIYHPSCLKQYNNRWFLFGYNAEMDKYDWNLALDRIISIRESKEKYKENIIDWEEYFEDMIGVTKVEGHEPEEIILVFKGITGRYVESKPLHGSQKSKWIAEDTLEVKLNLIINFEFERLVLSYADTVKVVKPEKLADTIINKSKGIQDIYL
jgi:predicted DNA-binding transcriptional regulator YafY